MIRVIVGYDDNDYELGDYFEQSYNDLKESFKDKNIDLIPIQGLECNEDKLKEVIKSFDDEKFVVIGLMHGNENQIVTENEIFVDRDDIEHLTNSLLVVWFEQRMRYVR